MNTSNDLLTPNDLLEIFYDEYNLGDDGGNHLSYVTLEVYDYFKIYIPNWDNRRKAVLRHDIHHLLTGYKSELLGEFEIAAWEIASGCMKYKAAYLLNSYGLLAGILVYFKPTFRAFIRGCRTENLYNSSLSEEQMKVTKIAELKSILSLNVEGNDMNPGMTEVLKLIGHLFLGVLIHLFSIFLVPVLFIYNVWIRIFKL